MYRFSPGIHNVRNPDGGVVLDVPRDRIIRVNACGAAILELVEQELSEGEIVGEIETRFGIQHDIALSDVRDFLRSLVNRGVLCFSKRGPSV